MKIICDRRDDRLVAADVLGPHACAQGHDDAAAAPGVGDASPRGVREGGHGVPCACPCAFPGDDLCGHHFVLKHLRKAQLQPQTIIICFSWFYFYINLTKTTAKNKI